MRSTLIAVTLGLTAAMLFIVGGWTALAAAGAIVIAGDLSGQVRR